MVCTYVPCMKVKGKIPAPQSSSELACAFPSPYLSPKESLMLPWRLVLGTHVTPTVFLCVLFSRMLLCVVVTFMPPDYLL